MAGAEPEYVEFATGDAVEAVVAVMSEMAATHRGWINFEPAVHVEDVPPPRSGLFSLFSMRGPDVPLATWTPGAAHAGRSGRSVRSGHAGRSVRSGHAGRAEPVQVGILHPSGPQAKAKLGDRGAAIPEGWVVLQDHSKKGLVVAVPPSVGHADVVAWLLRAAGALSVIPLTGMWRAAVYTG